MSTERERHDGGGDVAKSGGSPVKEGPAYVPDEDDGPERGSTPEPRGGRGDDWDQTSTRKPQTA